MFGLPRMFAKLLAANSDGFCSKFLSESLPGGPKWSLGGFNSATSGQVGRRKRTENAFAKPMQQKRAAEVAQERAKDPKNIRSGKPVGSPGAIGMQSVEQVGGMTAAGGGGGRR